MYDHATAIALIESRFPALAADFHDEIIDGLLHPQLGAFSRYAQAAIDSGDFNTWGLITDTFMNLWLSCDAALQNALNVSFLEHLDFGEQRFERQQAFASMPTAMRDAWSEMDEYNRKVHGG